MLGASGLGKHQAHFVIIAVKNQYRQDILIHNSIDMRNYAISTVGEYVDYRMRKMQRGQAGAVYEGVLIFHTPFTVKYQGAFIQDLHMEPVIASIRRRLYMLDCFEGIEAENFFGTRHRKWLLR